MRARMATLQKAARRTSAVRSRTTKARRHETNEGRYCEGSLRSSSWAAEGGAPEGRGGGGGRVRGRARGQGAQARWEGAHPEVRREAEPGGEAEAVVRLPLVACALVLDGRRLVAHGAGDVALVGWLGGLF